VLCREKCKQRKLSCSIFFSLVCIYLIPNNVQSVTECCLKDGVEIVKRKKLTFICSKFKAGTESETLQSRELISKLPHKNTKTKSIYICKIKKETETFWFALPLTQMHRNRIQNLKNGRPFGENEGQLLKT
jgi:hypothetical protein